MSLAVGRLGSNVLDVESQTKSSMASRLCMVGRFSTCFLELGMPYTVVNEISLVHPDLLTSLVTGNDLHA